MMDDLKVMRAAPQKTQMPDLPMKPVTAPQPTVAQRRRNQQGQPRDRVGKYAEKPGSKWKQHLAGTTAAPTSLKQQKTPARPSSVAPRKRTQTQMPAMAAMEHAHPIAKVHWWVTRGFRRWRRRKVKALKALFSLKG